MTCEQVLQTLSAGGPDTVDADTRFHLSLHVAGCFPCSTFLMQKTAAEGVSLSPEENARCDDLSREYLKEMLDEHGGPC